MDTPTQFLPPKDISSAELWTKLMEMPRPGKVIPYPRREVLGDPTSPPIGHIRVQILNWGELQAAKSAGLARAKRVLGKDAPGKDDAQEDYTDLVDMYQRAEIALKAIMKHDAPSERFFRDMSDLENRTTPDEIALILNEYMVIQAELGPFCSLMDQTTADIWLDALEQGGLESDPFVFGSLGQLTVGALRKLLQFSVARSASLRRPLSSASTQPAELPSVESTASK